MLSVTLEVEYPSTKPVNQEPKKEIKSKNLYLTGLPQGVTEEIIRKVFSTFGEITSIKVEKSNSAVTKLNYGFVVF
jgi:RNA recognition motif-containing protein